MWLRIRPKLRQTAPQTNACDHPYMPIRVGSKWSYVDSDGAIFDLEVLEINEVNGIPEASLQQILEFQGETIIIDYAWQCKPEGIDMLMAGIYALPFNIQGEIDYSSEGVSLPKESNLDTGATWEFSYTIQF